MTFRNNDLIFDNVLYEVINKDTLEVRFNDYYITAFNTNKREWVNNFSIPETLKTVHKRDDKDYVTEIVNIERFKAVKGDYTGQLRQYIKETP